MMVSSRSRCIDILEALTADVCFEDVEELSKFKVLTHHDDGTLQEAQGAPDNEVDQKSTHSEFGHEHHEHCCLLRDICSSQTLLMRVEDMQILHQLGLTRTGVPEFSLSPHLSHHLEMTLSTMPTCVSCMIAMACGEMPTTPSFHRKSPRR